MSFRDRVVPVMLQHEREPIVRKAESELDTALLDIIERHALTPGETLRIVNAFASSYVSNLAKHWIRDERHGDTNKAGGMAPDHRNGCGDPTCKGCA